VQTGVIGPMACLLVLVVSKLVLRKAWLAVLPLGLAYLVSYVAAAPSLVSGIVVGVLTVSLLLVLLVRFGLVAMLGAQVVATVLVSLPVTRDVSAWYFATGVFGVFAAVAVAAFGLWAALAGRPASTWDFRAPRGVGWSRSGG